jgi:hypothetical protein
MYPNNITLIKEVCIPPKNPIAKEVIIFLNIEKLKRRAFHLRQRIDAIENRQQKQQLIEDYVRIIWQIQNY